MKFTLTVIAVFMILVSSSVPVAGQTSQSGIGPTLPMASAASFYYISKPGEVTMQVNIWGAIKNPGRYEVPGSTDLIQLVSYAGGPGNDAKLDEVRITRAVKRPGAESRDEVVVNLEELGRVDATRLILYPGDTIFIDHTGWSSFRDVLTVVTTAALLSTAVANIIIAERR